jgi:hypothetical protein
MGLPPGQTPLIELAEEGATAEGGGLIALRPYLPRVEELVSILLEIAPLLARLLDPEADHVFGR